MRKGKSKCAKCYGKGYSTCLTGGSIARDFDSCPFDIGVKLWRVPIALEIRFCTCHAGKLAARKAGAIVSAERRRLKITRKKP